MTLALTYCKRREAAGPIPNPATAIYLVDVVDVLLDEMIATRAIENIDRFERVNLFVVAVQLHVYHKMMIARRSRFDRTGERRIDRIEIITIFNDGFDKLELIGREEEFNFECEAFAFQTVDVRVERLTLSQVSLLIVGQRNVILVVVDGEIVNGARERGQLRTIEFNEK